MFLGLSAAVMCQLLQYQLDLSVPVPALEDVDLGDLGAVVPQCDLCLLQLPEQPGIGVPSGESGAVRAANACPSPVCRASSRAATRSRTAAASPSWVLEGRSGVAVAFSLLAPGGSTPAQRRAPASTQTARIATSTDRPR